MKIHRIAVQNFRSFKEKIELNNIKPVSVFVGANNTGKSNIIEVLSFLRGMAQRSSPKPISEYIFDRTTDPMLFEVEFELNTERYSIVNLIPSPNTLETVDLEKSSFFKYIKYEAHVTETRCSKEVLYVTDHTGNYVKIIEHLWTYGNNNVECNYANIAGFFHGSGGAIDTFLESKLQFVKSTISSNVLGIFEPMPESQAVAYNIVKIIINFLGKITILGAKRKVNPSHGASTSTKLLETGENLIEVLSAILGADYNEHERIMNEYNKILGNQLKVNVPPAGSGGTHTIKIEETGLKSQTDFPNMSTGLHEALILVLAIEKAEPNETICIEEPEIHLHASAQKRLFRYIIEHSKKNQFFITTHSSLFTAINDYVNTYLLTRSKGISLVSQINDNDDLKLIRQQLGIRNSDVFGNDYVIFTEGQSEEVAFPIIATALGYDKIGTDIGNQIRIINLKGNGIIPRLRQFLVYLKSIGVEVFLIADGDKLVNKEIPQLVKEDLLRDNHYKIWPMELEDTFESQRIIKAMQKIQDKFLMTVEELEKERKNGKKVGKIIQDYLHNKTLPELHKPDLTKQLALDIENEVRNNSTRKETDVEIEIKRVMEQINSIETSAAQIGF